jgi:hypothetical protein
MLKRFFGRIHESFALAAIFAGSIALHVAWIDHLFISRSESFAQWVTLNPSVGPISGLYIDVIASFFVALLLAAGVWRGRDVSAWRERIFLFFIVSIVVFMVMTLPFVYGFAVT